MPVLVRPEMAHRRLASRAQERLSNRGPTAQDAGRLKRAIAINLVIWRIMLMTLLGPNAQNCLRSRTLRLTCCRRMQKNRTRQPVRLGDAVRLTARLGGHLGRANDPPSGHQLLWQGYRQLQAMRITLKMWNRRRPMPRKSSTRSGLRDEAGGARCC